MRWQCGIWTACVFYLAFLADWRAVARHIENTCLWNSRAFGYVVFIGNTGVGPSTAKHSQVPSQSPSICHYSIQKPPGSRVKLVFTFISVGSSTSVVIYDGTNSSASKLEQLSSKTSTPHIVQSSTNHVYILVKQKRRENNKVIFYHQAITSKPKVRIARSINEDNSGIGDHPNRHPTNNNNNNENSQNENNNLGTDHNNLNTLMCPDPGGLTNGRRIGNNFAVGASVHWECNPFYEHHGTDISVCEGTNGTSPVWVPGRPTCRGQCGGHFTLSAGRVVSPNYPDAYGTGSQCTWHVNTPPGKQVSMKMDYWHVNVEDTIILTDGKSVLRSSNICNPTSCASFRHVTPQNYFTLTFFSTFQEIPPDAGFVMSFRAVDPANCEQPTAPVHGTISVDGLGLGSVVIYSCIPPYQRNGIERASCILGTGNAPRWYPEAPVCSLPDCSKGPIFLQAGEGAIVSPGWPGKQIIGGKSCYWEITAAPGMSVMLHFHFFELPTQVNIYLDIFEGDTSDRNHVIRLTSPVVVPMPYNFTSSTEKVILQFQGPSHTSVGVQGFYMDYGAVMRPSTVVQVKTTPIITIPSSRSTKSVPVSSTTTTLKPTPSPTVVSTSTVKSTTKVPPPIRTTRSTVPTTTVHVIPVTTTQRPASTQEQFNPNRGRGPNTGAIVAGILVPLAIALFIGAIMYFWYRKKYPVRMIVGRQFSKYSNPAYDNKRKSNIDLNAEPQRSNSSRFRGSLENPGFENGDLRSPGNITVNHYDTSLPDDDGVFDITKFTAADTLKLRPNSKHSDTDSNTGHDSGISVTHDVGDNGEMKEAGNRKSGLQQDPDERDLGLSTADIHLDLPEASVDLEVPGHKKSEASLYGDLGDSANHAGIFSKDEEHQRQESPQVPSWLVGTPNTSPFHRADEMPDAFIGSSISSLPSDHRTSNSPYASAYYQVGESLYDTPSSLKAKEPVKPASDETKGTTCDASDSPKTEETSMSLPAVKDKSENNVASKPKKDTSYNPFDVDNKAFTFDSEFDYSNPFSMDYEEDASSFGSSQPDYRGNPFEDPDINSPFDAPGQVGSWDGRRKPKSGGGNEDSFA